jgi:hypothetical protein
VAPVDYLRSPSLVATAVRPRRTVLLLSHMRSYSSLISHILGSSPEIDGYVEMQRQYASRTDLVRLRLAVARMNGDRLSGRYVLDKVLHDKWQVDDAVLRDRSVYPLFSVREPEATIKSTVAMALSRKGGASDWKADVAKVGDYYIGRCASLVSLAERRPARSAFFVGERLIDRSEETLAMLTSYLGLSTPLSSSYEKFENTQKRKYGDPSENIAAGEIKRERKQHDVEVPAEILDRCRAAYTGTVEQLLSRCDVTLPGDHP